MASNQFDRNSLTNLMSFLPTLKATANFYGLSEDTIARRIKEWDNCTFTEFKERHSFGIKQRLINRAFEMAMSGNATMMIFCLKNYCGWADKPEETQQKDTTIQIVIDREDLAL